MVQVQFLVLVLVLVRVLVQTQRNETKPHSLSLHDLVFSTRASHDLHEMIVGQTRRSVSEVERRGSTAMVQDQTSQMEFDGQHNYGLSPSTAARSAASLNHADCLRPSSPSSCSCSSSWQGREPVQKESPNSSWKYAPQETLAALEQALSSKPWLPSGVMPLLSLLGQYPDVVLAGLLSADAFCLCCCFCLVLRMLGSWMSWPLICFVQRSKSSNSTITLSRCQRPTTSV